MTGHGGVDAGEGVVEEKARAHVEAVPHPVLEREQEGRGMDQVGGDLLHEQAALVQRLAHELDVEVLEITQPTVDELAGATRGTGREVAFSKRATDSPRLAASSAAPQPVTPPPTTSTSKIS